jgi:RNA polymerase sigma factor (sigma-70 family)
MATRKSTRKPYMVAVFLGTALSALGGSAGAAELQPNQSNKVISDLGRYCTTCWKNARLNPDAWEDCTQDVLGRILERIPTDHWNQVFVQESSERREFLRAIDTVKKRSQRARKWYSSSLDEMQDNRNLAQGDLQEKREILDSASSVLSERQKRILDFTKQGWSVAEIAKELKAGADRVSDEKYKAIQKLRVAVRDLG